MNAGKIIGGLIGFGVGGLFTALLGVFVGHQFDRGLGGLLNPMSAEQRQRIQTTFFNTVFSTLGHLAKADGRISKLLGLSAKMSSDRAFARQLQRKKWL